MTAEENKLVCGYLGWDKFNEDDWNHIMFLLSKIELTDSNGNIWGQITPSGCIITFEQRNNGREDPLLAGRWEAEHKQYISMNNKPRAKIGKKREVLIACLKFLKENISL